jgi:hypothetical protein
MVVEIVLQIIKLLHLRLNEDINKVSTITCEGNQSRTPKNVRG